MNIGVPHLVHRAVQRPRGWRSALMWCVFWSMLAVCIAAAVGAMRQIIVAWSGDVQFFS